MKSIYRLALLEQLETVDRLVLSIREELRSGRCIWPSARDVDAKVQNLFSAVNKMTGIAATALDDTEPL